MAPRGETLTDEEPPAIEPYTVLGLSKDATADQVKTAYRKAALKHHPGKICSLFKQCSANPSFTDKVPENLQDEAKIKFQEIAFAYAVLSDPVRRKRYDVTGSTAESIDIDDFSWSEFYQEQFRDIVTADAIEKFSKSYKGSPEEQDDVLQAYRNSQGKWGGVYESVMLSNPLEDEDRFRVIIDEAIAKGEVQVYKAYTNETARAKEARMKAARDEGEEALAYAKEMGVDDKLFGKGKGGKKESSEAALSALIKKNQAGRSSFLDQLEAKYAGNGKATKGKKGKKHEVEDDDGEPSEEAFQAAAARIKNKKAREESSSGRKAKRPKN
jgi:DnaJ family protein C protein 9